MAQTSVIVALPQPFVKQRPSLTHTTPRLPPHLGIGIGILAVSTASIFIRFAQQAGAPSLVIAAYRLTLASLILIPVALWRHRAELRALTRREWLLAATSGVFLGAHFGTWISSLAYTTVASSAVIVNTAPLFVALISAVFLRERPSRAIGIGMVIALIGGMSVGLSDTCSLAGCPPLGEFVRGRAFIGDLLALAGAGAFAIYYVIGGKLRASMSLITYISLTYGSAAVVLMAVMLAARLPATGYAPTTYLWFLLLALIPQLIGHSAFNWALKYLPATFVAVTVLGEPIGSTILALFLLRETPSVLKVLGGALILVGILIASQQADRR